ncbi:hypothetical protein WJX81_001647 [Elliptochloris bilobata]|uniref:Transcription factor IIIC 90kDa subunit N-terminal domain-containing protein n=1 Tax=Elliptochloris bilobata TaxID=381761 RepID=A0AAW1RWE9_9CHLO
MGGADGTWDALLEVQASDEHAGALFICILDPSTPQEHEVLHCPCGVGTGERLVALEWSPPGSQVAFQVSGAPVAVCWLEAPSPWRWPPKRARSISGDAGSEVLDGVEAPFGPHYPPGAGLHWARPATLPAAAVTRQGTLEVFWRRAAAAGSAPRWQQSVPLALPLAAPLERADVAATHAGALQVLAVSSSAPARAAVLAVSGDPTCITSAGLAISPLEVGPVAMLEAQEGRRVLHALFDPSSAGSAVVMQTQEHATGKLRLERWRATAAPAPPGNPQNPFGSEDVALLSGSALQVGQRIAALPRLTAIALSPNALLLGTVGTRPGSAGCLLRVTLLPGDADASSGGTDAAGARLLGDRLCWSMATRTSAWDVLAALRAQPVALAGALAAADAAVHAHPKTPRPGYARALNRLKAIALRGVSDFSADAVLQDVWARSTVAVVTCGIRALVRNEEAPPKAPAVPQQPPAAPSRTVTIDPADAAAISSWVTFVEELGGAFVAAVRRWVEAHAAAAEGAVGKDPDPNPVAHAAADALPGPRLLCDNLFMHDMREVLMIAALALKSQPDSGGKARLSALMAALQQISQALGIDQKAAGATEDGTTSAACFQGTYALHYARTSGGVRPLLAFRSAGGALIPALADAPALTHEQEMRALAPDGALVGWLGPLTPSNDMFASRRKRWRAERDAAFGLPTSADVCKWNGCTDSISLRELGWSAPPWHAASDGAGCTAELGFGAPGLRQSAYSQVVRQAWLNACPVTGAPWRCINPSLV